MEFSGVRPITLAVVAFGPVALLTGCGGGTSGGSTSTPTGTTIQYKATGATPIAAVVQVNGGAWTALTFSGSTASFTVPATTSPYAIAVLCPATSSSSQQEEVYEALASDTVSPSSACPVTVTPTQVTTNVTFDASAFGAMFSRVSIGGYGSGSTGTASASINSPTGVQDVVVATYGSTPNNAPLALKIDRGVNITGAPITIPAMTASDATGSAASILVNGIPSGFTGTSSSVIYYTANGSVTVNGPQTVVNGGTTLSSNYAPVASADTQTGDSYVSFQTAENSSNTAIVEAQQSFATAQNVALTFPGALNYAGPTAAAYPTFNASYNGFTISAKTSWFARINWTKSANNYQIAVYATSAYLGSNPISIPNLTSLSGFLAPQTSGGSVTWSLSANSQTLPVYGNTNVPLNQMAQYAFANGTYVEP